MTDYTTDEITESAPDESSENSWAGSWWEELADSNDGYKSEITLRGNTVEVEKVASKPAEEGGGDTIFVVIRIGTQFFKKEGYYVSHDGEYWDGYLTEVFPEEKTITVYEPK